MVDFLLVIIELFISSYHYVISEGQVPSIDQVPDKVGSIDLWTGQRRTCWLSRVDMIMGFGSFRFLHLPGFSI